MNFRSIFLSLLLAFSSFTFSAAYEDDASKVDFYVPSILANEAMKSPNFLLCFVAKTNFGDFIDKTAYRALVDEAACEDQGGADTASESAAATGSSASTGGTEQTTEVSSINYTPGVYENKTSGTTVEGKGWVTLNLSNDNSADSLKAKALVKTVLSKDPDADSPFGDFQMNYEVIVDGEQSIAGFPLDPIPDGYLFERGYLKTSGKTIEFKITTPQNPKKAAYADLSNPSAQHGLIKSLAALAIPGDPPTLTWFEMHHKVFVDDTNGIYCQKFDAAQQMNHDGTGLNYSPVGDVLDEAAFSAAIAGAFANPPTAQLAVDGGTASTITGEHCWNTRASEAKKVVYEYGTYTSAGAKYTGADTSAVSAMSLRSKENNPATARKAYAHASYWGTYVNPIDRAFVTDATLFTNESDDSDTNEYTLEKIPYEIWRNTTSLKALTDLDGVGVQWHSGHYKNDTSGATNWAAQVAALGVPIAGACNAADGNCPEYKGKISVSGTTVTFTLTEGMDWRTSPPTVVTLANPITFTAANWVTNMTGGGWNRGMHFWDPDAQQSYNIRYTSFQNPTSAVEANAVKLRLSEKIGLDALPNTVACFERCLSQTRMDTAFTSAALALQTNAAPGALNVTPYFDTGPYLKVDSYYDVGGDANVYNAGIDYLMPAGRHNHIGGVHLSERRLYDKIAGQIVDDTSNEILGNWAAGIAPLVASGAAENRLRPWEYWEKNNALGAGVMDGVLGYTVLEDNHSNQFGNYFRMTVVSSADAGFLVCETDGGNVRGYTDKIRNSATNAAVLQAGPDYYCLDKLYRGDVTSYEIKVLTKPSYRVKVQATGQYANIMTPEVFEVAIDNNKAAYNFSGSDKTDFTDRKVRLKFEGFGQLHNFPGKVYNHCTNTVVGRYYNGQWSNCLRYIPEFSLKDGTVLTNLTNPGNDIKVRQLRGDEYLKKLSTDEVNALPARTYSSTAANLPLESVFLGTGTPSSSDYIGAEPTTILNNGDPSVIHGVTIVPPQ